MPFNTPEDTMPWVGLYVAIASLVCILAMAIDAFHGFLRWKHWFPNKYFTLNAASLTLIAIAMKLPVDLNSNRSGVHDHRNIAKVTALIVPASRRNLERQYKELHKLSLNDQDINFSYKELTHHVKKYWMMAETGNPQFALACSQYTYNSLLKKLGLKPSVSEINVRAEMEEYKRYVLQIEDDTKFSNRILRNTLNSITRLLQVSEKKSPKNLIKLLQTSKGFNGVIEFDDERVPPLISEVIENSWSLVVVTLTAIGIALPSLENNRFKRLLLSVAEGLYFVRHVEECLNNVGESLASSRKVAQRVGLEVEVYQTWLQIDLQKMARKGKTSKEIIQWLSDEAIQIVKQFKNYKNASLDHSFHKFVAANSMYRISQTLLVHYNEQQHWQTDQEVYERVTTIIADILFACFTNLSRVIIMKCHHDAIEKRQDSIRTAAQILGKSKKILSILETRQLPDMDKHSMAYVDKWRALSKNQIPSENDLESCKE
ncbi:uncharacterized protein [Rutidosis leptorrhynchoides]|uniref:uncharacterized protein n=1 Tax=Rutidosis leptorrhynchoides TaxID=125765 RepID=UPI003A9A06C7